MPAPKTSTITPELLQEFLRYEPETGFFFWKKQAGRARVGERAGYVRGDGRYVVRLAGEIHLGYRVAFLAMLGRWPVCEVDHADGDSGNNRWSNLREASRLQNCLNTSVRQDNRSGFKGAQYSKYHRKWRARFRGKVIGYFSSPEAASDAYLEFATNFAGEFARR